MTSLCFCVVENKMLTEFDVEEASDIVELDSDNTTETASDVIELNICHSCYSRCFWRSLRLMTRSRHHGIFVTSSSRNF